MHLTLSRTLNRYTLLWLGLALLLYTYLMLFHNALIDDTFITLNYVKTLTAHGTWGFYAISTTNTATSPLNVLALSLVTLVTRSPLESVFWLTLLEWVALGFFLRRIGQLLALRWFGLIAFPALVLNPLVISTLGLESILFTTLLTAALYSFLAKRFYAFAVAAALLTLTRPEGILFLPLALFFLPNWTLRLRVTALYALCLTPWYLYSWIVLGSFLPDTFLIKVRQSWGDLTFANGLPFYERRYPVEIALSFVFLPAALLNFLKPVRSWSTAGWLVFLFGILHFAAYTLLHVPPYHWYYVPEVVCVILLGALALAQWAQTPQEGWRRALSLGLVALALVVPFSGMVYLMVRAGAPLDQSFVQTNWATPAQYRTVGTYLQLHNAGETISTDGEPATIAYYCDCYLLDYTFTVRDWVTGDVNKHRAGSSLTDYLWRINYHFYKPSAPYPPPTANLKVFTQATQPSDPTLPHWFTSNHWVKAGLIVLNEK